MDYKKSLLVFCLIMCILFTVSSVAAGDVNDTAIASEDTTINDEVNLPLEKANEQNSEVSDDALAIDENSKDVRGINQNDVDTIITKDDAFAINENSEDILAIDQNDMDTIIAKDNAKDETFLKVQNTDENILSYTKTINFKIVLYKQTGNNANNKKIYFKVTNLEEHEDDSYAVVQFDLYKNGKYVDSAYVEANRYGEGVLAFSKFDKHITSGTYILKAFYASAEDMEIYYEIYYDNVYIKCNSPKMKVVLAKQSVTIKPKKLTTKYKAKKYFKAKVVKTNTKKPLKGIPVNMVIYTGKTAKVVTLKSNAKGIIAYPTSKLSVGAHKVVLKVKKNKYYAGKATKSVIKIKNGKNKKASVTVVAKKLTAKYKAKKYFFAKVVKTTTKKPLKGIPVNMVIYTGKTAKVVTLKSNAKGIIAYPTSKLSVGTHKVVLKVKKNKYYAGKATKSVIKITKKKSSSKKISTTLSLGGPGGLTYEWHYADTGLNDGVVIYPKLIDSNGRTLTKKVTVITSSGEETGYTGRGIFLGNDFDADFVPMTRGGTARIIFYGDSQYAGSEYTVYF